MAEANKSDSRKLAVILVRGLARVRKPVKDTLHLLRLKRKNNCVVLADNPVNKGMCTKVKDYVTWGEISPERFQELVKRRGEKFQSRETDRKGKYSYRSLEYQGQKYKPYFRLSPPQKGFGRKGIKVAFKAGGGLGDRGDKINDLIMRML